MRLSNAPTPDLRIVPIQKVIPHEEHDSQRAQPLIERIRRESFVINPPIVAPVSEAEYVILDGANRVYAFQALGHQHLLVQCVQYDSGFVELETWNHVISAWTVEEFIEHLASLPEIHMIDGQDANAIAHIVLRTGRVIALRAPVETVHERNAALRRFVNIYQQHAVLHRTAISEPETLWTLFEDGIALVFFPPYQPVDIIAAARQRAFLPPGVSRHIVHGRAVQVNYPIARLLDSETSLEQKNEDLQRWLRQKMARREIRYYAEATYQFDE